MNKQTPILKDINENFDAEALILGLFDSMDNHQIFRLLNPLSTEEKFTVWEVIENELKEISRTEHKHKIAEISKIYSERSKLLYLRKKIIYFLLVDPVNGLLNMFTMKIFPETQLSGSSVSEPLNITAYPENGMGIMIEEDKITFETIKELYDKIKLGGGCPYAVTQQLMEINNITLTLIEIQNKVDNLKPENNLVLDALINLRVKMLGLLDSTNLGAIEL